MTSNPSLARALRQSLEAWSASGITQLPAPRPVPIEIGSTQSQPFSAATANPPLSAVTDAETTKISSRLTLDEPAVSPTPAAAPESLMPKRASRAEREAGLAILQQQVAACRRCDELARTRTQTVFGVGNPAAKILFVGEAPGADEDKQGEPFVGRAGQLLTKIIEACKLRRGDIYIANILKCRPPNNRPPLPDECGNCREHLDGQIRIIDPEYIVCWGSVAAHNLLGQTTPISKMRGRFFQHGRAKVLCTFHPSYLLRNPPAKKDVWLDMQFLFADMGIDLLAETKPK